MQTIQEKRPAYRFVILVAAVCIQICLGATYSWSIFVEPLRELLQKGQAALQIPFSVFYHFFPLTMIFSGFILAGLGLRVTLTAGILLFATGWITAGSFGTSVSIITLGIGIIAGVGAGLAYLIPIKVCMQWFPRHKGLATGVAVAGFGGGAALLSQAGRYMMENLDLSPLSVMLRFGIFFALSGTIASLLLKSPPGVEQQKVAPLNLLSVITQKRFILLYAGMFAGLAGGFAVIANLKQINPHATPLTGATGISLFAIFNAVGRIVWGALHDRAQKGTHIIFANLISQAVLLIFASVLAHRDGSFYLFSAIAGFNYGGVLVIYAAEVGKHWGAERVPVIYGWIFSSNIPGSLSPIFAGFFFDTFNSFTPAFIVIGAFMIATAFVLKKHYPAVS